MTRVFWADISPLSDDIIFEAAKKRLPPFRLEKFNKLKFRKAQSLSIASWLVLSEALKGFPGYCKDDSIVFSPNGKPFFYNNPNVHFNISHSGNIAVCSVSDKETGVDVQEICDFKESICRRYFSKSEADFVLKSSDDVMKKDNFFRIWTLKEAYSKMTGGGLGEFRKFEVVIGNTASVKSYSELNNAAFSEFEINGYKTAVCTAGNERDFEFKRVSIIEILIN